MGNDVIVGTDSTYYLAPISDSRPLVPPCTLLSRFSEFLSTLESIVHFRESFMKPYVAFAILAGVAWGLGGYFEKAGLRAMGIPPIAGITLRTLVALVLLGLLSLPSWKAIANPSDAKAWLMIIIGGGIIAGSLGMWSFYSSLSLSENLGTTLALAFAFSPLTGTVVGLIRGDQHLDVRLALGLIAIVAGIVLVQLSHSPAKS